MVIPYCDKMSESSFRTRWVNYADKTAKLCAFEKFLCYSKNLFRENESKTIKINCAACQKERKSDFEHWESTKWLRCKPHMRHVSKKKKLGVVAVGWIHLFATIVWLYVLLVAFPLEPWRSISHEYTYYLLVLASFRNALAFFFLSLSLILSPNRLH